MVTLFASARRFENHSDGTTPITGLDENLFWLVSERLSVRPRGLTAPHPFGVKKLRWRLWCDAVRYGTVVISENRNRCALALCIR